MARYIAVRDVAATSSATLFAVVDTVVDTSSQSGKIIARTEGIQEAIAVRDALNGPA